MLSPGQAVKLWCDPMCTHCTLLCIDCLLSTMYFMFCEPVACLNSGVTGRGQSASRDFWLGNFYWSTGKTEAREKGKMGKKKENWKEEGGKLKKSGKMTLPPQKKFPLTPLCLNNSYWFVVTSSTVCQGHVKIPHTISKYICRNLPSSLFACLVEESGVIYKDVKRHNYEKN